MGERPDSALNLILGIDRSLIDSDSNSARYALLKTMALHKNYIDISDDSIISVASNYYDAESTPFEALLSNYYHGVILFNAKLYDKGMLKALEALRISKTLGEKLWEARSHELIADISSYSCIYDYVIDHRQQAVDIYKDLEMRGSELYALADIGLNLTTSEEYDKSISLLDSVRQIAINEQKDSALYAFCTATLIKPIFRIKDYDRVINTYNEFIPYRSVYHLSSTKLAFCAYASLMLNNINDYDKFMAMAKECAVNIDDSCMIKNIEIARLRMLHDYETAFNNYDDLLKQQNQFINDVLNKSVLYSERDYAISQSQKAIESEQKARRNLFLIVTISIIIFIFISTLTIYFIKYKNKKIDDYVSELILLTNTATIHTVKSERLELDLKDKISKLN